MRIFKNLKGHFSTITHHKMLVMKTCFKVGLYKQGLLHDSGSYLLSGRQKSDQQGERIKDLFKGLASS